MSNWSDGNDGTGGGDGEAQFDRLSNLVASNIRKIQNNVMSLERMVQQIGTEADSEVLRGKVHEATASTNQLAKDANRHLKELASLADSNRVWRLEKERLTNDLMAVLNNFQSAQRAAAKKEKDSVSRARANSHAAAAGDGGATSPTSPAAQKQLQLEQNVDLAAIQEREQAIRQLETDIVGVNQIFKDLASMVHEQGDMVDSIEANVETAVSQVEAGARNVQRASQYQTSARKKKVCLAVTGVVVLVILIVVIYYASQN